MSMFWDSVAVKQLKELHETFRFKTFVETGTLTGESSLKATEICPQVVTLEIQPESQAKAFERWRAAGFIQSGNTFLHPDGRLILSLLGNSPDLLSALLKDGDLGTICFFLDAHWHGYWPLQDELKAIANAKPPRCLIIIHDFKVPGKPFQFDSYGGQDLDLPYVKPGLDLINPEFKIFFNETCKLDNGAPQVGILYAVPKA